MAERCRTEPQPHTATAFAARGHASETTGGRFPPFCLCLYPPPIRRMAMRSNADPIKEGGNKMQFNFEISSAEQTVKLDEKTGGQPEHIRRHIEMARRSYVLTEMRAARKAQYTEK